MRSKLLVDILKPTIQSDTVFIIGGGPSLLKYLPEPGILNQKYIIATNNAYSLYPNAMLCHFGDRCWFNWNKTKLLSTFKGYITTSDHRYQREHNDYNIYNFLTGNKKGGLNLDPDRVDGNNSGHQAINIAYHLGFKKIVLIGFDMTTDNRTTHWHKEHQRVTNVGLYAGTMIPNLKKLADDAKKLEIRIVNINKDSAIKWFEFGELKDFL